MSKLPFLVERKFDPYFDSILNELQEIKLDFFFPLL